MKYNTHTLEPGCPWYDLSTWKLPNVKWCEASQCSWVTEPANTWSNLAYVVFGLALVFLASRQKSRLMGLFGWAQVVVGLFSGIYHASYTYVLQVFDFIGMYLFCMLPLCLNLIRGGKLSPASLFRAGGLGVVGMTALTLILNELSFPIQMLVLFLIVAIISTEVWVWKNGKHPLSYRYFFLSLGLMGTGATFSALDAARIFCDPNNHVIQGHAIWHVLTAAALVPLYFAYRPQEDVLLAPNYLGKLGVNNGATN